MAAVSVEVPVTVLFPDEASTMVVEVVVAALEIVASNVSPAGSVLVAAVVLATPAEEVGLTVVGGTEGVEVEVGVEETVGLEEATVPEEDSGTEVAGGGRFAEESVSEVTGGVSGAADAVAGAVVGGVWVEADDVGSVEAIGAGVGVGAGAGSGAGADVGAADSGAAGAGTSSA